MLEKFIQYCHSKHEGLSDYYITQIYNNMQELLYVQFLEAELQTQLILNENLEQKLSQDSQILHNIIEALSGDIDQSLCNDSGSLLEYLNQCEDQVKCWPKWKIESMRDAFGINAKKYENQAGTM